MFDREFRLSQFYFSILQILRIFTDTIEETQKEVEHTRRQFEAYFEPQFNSRARGFKNIFGDTDEEELSKIQTFRAMIDSEWGRVTSFQKGLATNLIEHIKKKSEEIESLRDGVSLRKRDVNRPAN